jgi:prepilin-type N-terminal cleavage/methylation domain-containing protein
MKPFNPSQNQLERSNFRGFTLAEMLIATAIFSMAIAAMIAIQLFGMRVYTLAATKLSATSGGRSVLNQIRDQIRAAKMLDVGNCSTPNFSSFQLIPTNKLQAGNALILYPATNTARCTIFYLDTSTPTNYLVQFNVSNNVTIYTRKLASYITNTIVFNLEDWQATTVTNDVCLDNRLLVRVTLQFYQWEYPIAKIGASNVWNAYDYYQLRTRVFRRAWN